ATTRKETPMHRWFLALPLLLLPAITTAATLVVSPSGSDSNPCTLDSPCRSIRQGISRLQSGDSLSIQGGTYAENNLHVPSNVTVEGAAGATVVIRPTHGVAPGFELGAGTTGTTIRNLMVDGGGGGISYGVQIFGQDNLLDHVEVANVQNQGIAIYYASGNHQGCGHGGNTLRNLHVHDRRSAAAHAT